ncbi:MAG: acylphosphatase [bacterium]
MSRKHIYFSGRVQGVGFRFHCQVHAQELSLTGYAKNLYDGRVEVEVQGTEANIARFIRALQNERFVHVDHVEIRDIPEKRGERGFRIGYF